jgi:cytoskeletal protein RodZ
LHQEYPASFPVQTIHDLDRTELHPIAGLDAAHRLPGRSPYSVIMGETSGEQLRRARQERLLTLEQAARATHIRQAYLEALEAGELDRLPSRVQARGFLRAYAAYLGLSPDDLLAEAVKQAAGAPDGEPSGVPASTQPSGLTSQQAQAVFTEIGQGLQEKRGTLGFSLEEVEQNTRIKVHFLKALEAGDLESLPSPVQGRGMLFNYATFLGIDPDPLLLRFAEGLQTRLAEKQALRAAARPARPVRTVAPFPVLRWLSFDFLLGGALIALLAGFVIWSVIRITALRSIPEPVVTVPSIAEELLSTAEGTPLVTPSPTPAPALETQVAAPLALATGQAGGEATPEAGLPTDSGALIQVYIVVVQRAWVRVTVDGEVEFEGRVVPGSAYGFDGEVQIELLTSNGAGLQVFFNQNDLGVLGEYGQVVFLVFTPQGLAEPTPTITPTPTVTQPVTATPQATATVQPSPAP